MPMKTWAGSPCHDRLASFAEGYGGPMGKTIPIEQEINVIAAGSDFSGHTSTTLLSWTLSVERWTPARERFRS